MDSLIPQIEAKNILLTYTGFNNQLLYWKKRLETERTFNLTKTQAEYVFKYHTVQPKVAKKYINIIKTHGEKIKEDYNLTETPTQIWCEKLLCESDKAYHIYGKYNDTDYLKMFWLPKTAVILPEKKLNREVDYSKYSVRPPMEHQKVAIEKLLANNKYILGLDMGLGKTTAAVIASLECDVKKVLIVCPATLKINWKKEIENYTDKKVLIVEGRKWGHTFDYYIINYDIIKNYHSVDKKDKDSDYNLLVNEKFDLAIVDEAHYLSNPSANRTLLLNDVLEKIPKVWLLTGTPMTSRPMNFYNLLKIVNSPVTLNWQHYVKRYCKGYQFTVNKKKVWNTSGASNLDELRELTKNLMHRKLKTEILDLPEKIITPIYIELKSSMYNEEIEEFIKIAEKDKRKDKLTIDITTLMRVRQLIAYEKIPYTCELIDKCIEQGKKVVILTNFTIVLDILHEKYKKNSVVLDGRMSSTKKQESVDKFQDDDKIKIFFGNIVAAGVGITLTAGEVVIMNDLSFVPAHHAQGEDRCFRIGQKKSVSILYPIFENTIEMIVYNILDKKKNIIDEVMGDGEYSESFTTDLVKELKENLKL